MIRPVMYVVGLKYMHHYVPLSLLSLLVCKAFMSHIGCQNLDYFYIALKPSSCCYLCLGRLFILRSSLMPAPSIEVAVSWQLNIFRELQCRK